MKWRTEIRLNFRRPKYSILRIFGRYRKNNVGFCFTWKAWLIAYDVFDVDPDSFTKLEPEKQIIALCYGAAIWDRIQSGKNVFFTYDEIRIGLDKATKEENRKLGETIKEAQFPDWLKKITPDSKKKVKSN